ncbi:phosphoprotein [Cytorhabdovirus gramineae]|uniref:Phosphoprotein n=1 Tax=Northern cereal mosaic virus TaxID=1985704 RepID=PHOSP_NCMV|nr:phosphoprotein [Cytorhabdovirus gramineae]Q9JGU0.1 RecName: Full=Phosphoprotein; Short=Protein P; AltName: Full=Protein M1 [Cytorhabdovirus gramineae]BAA95345.1 phosphoprotein [Cytorhabdovirus gramineae]
MDKKASGISGENALFGDVPNDVVGTTYEMGLDGIFDDGETDVIESPADAEEHVTTDIVADEGDNLITKVDDMIGYLKRECQDHGIAVRKEWVNVLTRKFHMSKKIYASHLDFFLLGVMGERHVAVEKDFKDTAVRLSDEVNKMSGISKKVADNETRMIKELDAKMKEMGSLIGKFNGVLNEFKGSMAVSSRPASVASWALDQTTETSREKNYNEFLKKLGFQDHHIKSPLMKKCTVMITDEMYDEVMLENTSEDTLGIYKEQIITYGQSIQKKVEKPIKKDPYADF